MRHRQSRTIWSRKIAKELLSLEREPRNMGEGSMGLSLGPAPSSASPDPQRVSCHILGTASQGQG